MTQRITLVEDLILNHRQALDERAPESASQDNRYDDNNNNLDALFADADLPFGHPRRRFDDTPEYFDHSPLLDQGSEPDYTLDEEGGVVH